MLDGKSGRSSIIFWSVRDVWYSSWKSKCKKYQLKLLFLYIKCIIAIPLSLYVLNNISSCSYFVATTVNSDMAIVPIIGSMHDLFDLWFSASVDNGKLRALYSSIIVNMHIWYICICFCCRSISIWKIINVISMIQWRALVLEQLLAL